jgi:acid phosphatase (class B)
VVFWLAALSVVGCAHCTQVVTIAEVESTLPDHPIAVGFDVDETLICSTPVWYYLATNHDGHDGSNKYGVQVRTHPDFWADANRLNSFSIPKQSARDLIALHQRRGDRIYILTSRIQTPGEQLSSTLRSAFGLDSKVPILFTNNKPKGSFIRELHLDIFYGDSDDDMREARAAGARPIRFLRSLRCADDRIHVSAFGEEVLAGSDLCIGFARAGPATRPAPKP